LDQEAKIVCKLKYARRADLGQGEPGLPDPALLIDGAPAFTTWPLIDGPIMTGTWSATPGHHRVVRDNNFIESFYILEGEIDLFEDGVPTPKRFGSGDLVVLEPGFTGSWKTVSAVKKVYFSTRL